MAQNRIVATVALCVLFVFLVLHKEQVEGRYLPTRSNTDKLDKLKDLLREVSELYKKCLKAKDRFNNNSNNSNSTKKK